jgi:hypothetical protein
MKLVMPVVAFWFCSAMVESAERLTCARLRSRCGGGDGAVTGLGWAGLGGGGGGAQPPSRSRAPHLGLARDARRQGRLQVDDGRDEDALRRGRGGERQERGGDRDAHLAACDGVRDAF